MSKPPPLPSMVRSRINRIAHAAGIRHENDTRARLIDELQRLIAAGSRLPELQRHLDAIDGG